MTAKERKIEQKIYYTLKFQLKQKLDKVGAEIDRF